MPETIRAADEGARGPMGAAFSTCACGHAIYEHGRIKPSGTPHYEYVACGVRNCPCLTFRASDGSRWPNGPAAGREKAAA